MKVLILGASGNIGRHLVPELLERGMEVCIGAREPRLTPEVELIHFDFLKPETYLPAMEGMDRLFLVTPIDPRILEWTQAIVKNARKAGIQHIVKVSAYGADHSTSFAYAKWHRLSEQIIEGSEISYTFLRPNTFMENWVQFYSVPIRTRGIVPNPTGPAKVSYICARDIAEIARIVLLEPGHKGKVYELTGPEAIPSQAIAAKLSQKLGREVTAPEMSEQALEMQMHAQNAPSWRIQALLEMVRFQRKGLASKVTQDFKKLTGHAACSIDDFLDQNRNYFIGASA